MIEYVVSGVLVAAMLVDEVRWRLRRRGADWRRARYIADLEHELGLAYQDGDSGFEGVTGSHEVTMGPLRIGPGVAIPVHGDPRDVVVWVRDEPGGTYEVVTRGNRRYRRYKNGRMVLQ